MKLVKIQKEILENAVASEAKNGVRKPIHVLLNGKVVANHPKSYQVYCQKMEQLIDAGFISRNENDGYAYITVVGENFINKELMEEK